MAEMNIRPEIGPQLRHAPELEMGTRMHLAPLGQVIKILLVAIFCLAIFNSQGLVNWSMKLPVSPPGEAVVWTVGGWHDLMTRIGATWPRIVLHQVFEDFKMF